MSSPRLVSALERKRMARGLALVTALGVSASAVAGGGVCPCEGDVNGNGIVDGEDLGELLGAWGACGDCSICASDLSGNCVVDGNDLGILLAQWGACPLLPPNNDACANATVVVGFTGSANPFCTYGANTDGPVIPADCSAPPIANIFSDVWFRVVAPITGTLQFGVCADFDVRMAIYDEGIFGTCACPTGIFPAPLLACSTTDSFVTCGQGTARLVPVEAGRCYTVRIGGATGQQGTGNLDINIYVPSCDLASSSTLTASGLDPDSEFGLNVDISGEHAVIGAIFDDVAGINAAGSARVYRLNAAGNGWIAEQTLTSPDAFEFQRFGVNSAIGGEWIVVGATEVDEDCNPDPLCDTGIVYVYHDNGLLWLHDQSLVRSGGSPADKFGTRVDVDGNRIVVGASDDTNANGTRAGAAYVFEYTNLFGGVWLQSAKLIAADGADFDNLGSDVAVSGTWAIVGARSSAADNSGAAYLYEDTGGAWPERQKLTPGVAAGANFGSNVAIDGDIALVGAPGYANDLGAVFVYERFGALGWIQTEVLLAHDGVAGDRFGTSTSISGDEVVVGAGSDDDVKGSAYVLWRVNGGWVQRVKLTASNGAAGDSFGGAAAIHNGRALIGAYFDDTTSGVDAGSVYFFDGLGECTGNGIADACDIANGLSDSDGDGVPDVCE